MPSLGRWVDRCTLSRTRQPGLGRHVVAFRAVLRGRHSVPLVGGARVGGGGRIVTSGGSLLRPAHDPVTKPVADCHERISNGRLVVLAALIGSDQIRSTLGDRSHWPVRDGSTPSLAAAASTRGRLPL